MRKLYFVIYNDCDGSLKKTSITLDIMQINDEERKQKIEELKEYTSDIIIECSNEIEQQKEYNRKAEEYKKDNDEFDEFMKEMKEFD